MSKHPHKTENPLLKECLFTALILLMDQKDFKDIKISEITQKAGVSRMTYYRTYDSKEDILIQYFDDRSKEIIKELNDWPDITTTQFFTLFFSFFQKHAHMIEYLHKADLLKQTTTKFIEFITNAYERSTNHLIDDDEKYYEIHFIAGGLFLMLLHWTESGMKESPEKMAQLTVQILRRPTAEPEKETD